MKTLIQIFVALLLLGVLAACTQNDGVIGDRFGLWRVTVIEADGEPETGYDGNMFWSFQAKVIHMIAYDGNDLYQSSRGCYGGCLEKDGKMILDFNNSDEIHEDEYYTPLTESHFPKLSTVTLDIIKKTGRRMILQYKAEDNTTYTYYLEKWD